jgi:hypothetical protein
VSDPIDEIDAPEHVNRIKAAPCIRRNLINGTHPIDNQRRVPNIRHTARSSGVRRSETARPTRCKSEGSRKAPLRLSPSKFGVKLTGWSFDMRDRARWLPSHGQSILRQRGVPTTFVCDVATAE